MHAAADRLRDGPCWLALPGALSIGECRSLIDLFDRAADADGGLAGGVTGLANIRRSRIAWLADDEAPWAMVAVAAAAAEANRVAFGYDLEGFDERLQLARYDGAEAGFYDWHVDRGHAPLTRTRKLSIVVQLSPPSDYGGGSLELNAEGDARAMPPDQGTAIVFPAFVLHRVAPVTSGIRYSMTAWVHGPRFR